MSKKKTASKSKSEPKKTTSTEPVAPVASSSIPEIVETEEAGITPETGTESEPETEPTPAPAWRVDVDLAESDEDFTLKAMTLEDAIKLVESAVSAGMVVRDRRQDQTVYSLEIVPIGRVRRFRIHEHKPL